MNLTGPIKNLVDLPAKRFAIGFLMMALNAGLTLFLIAIAGDGYVTYKQAFFISIPIIGILTVHFLKSFGWYYKKEQRFNFLDLIRFVMLIFSILLLVFNVFVWTLLIKAA